MNEIYFVMRDRVPVKVFLTRNEATKWAEDVYGSRSDGICVDGVYVQTASFKFV